MQIRYVFLICPLLIFFVENLNEPWKAGEARGPFIRIKKTKIDDHGLIAHEMTHVRQWYAVLILMLVAALIARSLDFPNWSLIVAFALAAHSVFYNILPVYRLWTEIQAYRTQARYYADDRYVVFAKFLSTHYRLNITPDAALDLLRGH